MMARIHFEKTEWVKENEYEYYIDVMLSEPQLVEIKTCEKCNIVVRSYGEVVPCEIRFISNKWIRIINDKPFMGNVTLQPKEYIENIKVDKISQVKNEIIEWSKVVEDLYESGIINPSAYFTMKGFEVVLNNIVDNKE